MPIFSVKVVSSSSDPKLDTLIAQMQSFIDQVNDSSLTQTELKQLMLQQQKLINLHLSSMTDIENDHSLCDMSLNEGIDNDY